MLKGFSGHYPSNVVHNFGDNERGHGQVFGVLAIENFLDATGLKLIIRSHQCIQSGIQNFESKNCITIFSSSGYAINNYGAVMLISDGNIKINAYEPIEHPSRANCLFYTIKPRNQDQKYSYTMISGFLRPSISSARMLSNFYSHSHSMYIRKFQSERKIAVSSFTLKNLVSPRISI